MILETMRKRLTVAMKENNPTEKSILRYMLGEINNFSMVKISDDEEVAGLIRQVIKKNNALMATAKEHDKDVGTMPEENEILRSLLPQTLSLDEIREALIPITADIQSIEKDGTAIGMAVKYIKTQNLNAVGSDVSKVVNALRAPF